MPVLPIAHLAHWAAVLYAAPVIVLLVWSAAARLSRVRGDRKIGSRAQDDAEGDELRQQDRQ